MLLFRQKLIDRSSIIFSDNLNNHQSLLQNYDITSLRAHVQNDVIGQRDEKGGDYFQTNELIKFDRQ